MLTIPAQGATASTVVAAQSNTPQRQTSALVSGATPPNPTPSEPYRREHVRHLIFGTATSLQVTIRHLHKLGYADPNDWSRPISTGRADEVMAILTKRVGDS